MKRFFSITALSLLAASSLLYGCHTALPDAHPQNGQYMAPGYPPPGAYPGAPQGYPQSLPPGYPSGYGQQAPAG